MYSVPVEGTTAIGLRPPNLIEFAFRLMEIVTQELFNIDLEQFHQVNDWLREYREVRTAFIRLSATATPTGDTEAQVGEHLSKLPGRWRPIKNRAIRPKNEIVLDLLCFKPKEMEEILNRGARPPGKR